MNKSLLFLLIIIITSSTGCVEHQVNTFHTWCEDITNVDLKDKYAHFWTISFSVSYDMEAVRTSYTDTLNQIHLEKVQHRAPRTAWRQDSELHILNLSTLLPIKPLSIIQEWSKGIALAKQNKHTKATDICLYNGLITFFDSLHIHTMDKDDLGLKWIDKVVIIKIHEETEKY